MTELYKALFDFITDSEDELSLKEGEIVKITNRDSPDWWLGERLNNHKEFGLIPSNFLEKLPPNEGLKLAVVIKDYDAQDPDELSLQKDRIITILDQNIAEGWWKGDLNGRIGVFPADHVELTKDNDEESKSKKDQFKLAAYGVKQGGIGSILAGGFSLKRTSINDKSASPPTITNKPPPPSNIQNSKPLTLSNPKSDIDSIHKISPSKSTFEKKAMVIHEYLPQNEDEIKLLRGEYVRVIDQLEDDGWWKGINESGETGVFPSNFAQIIDQEAPPPRPIRHRPATVKSDTSNKTDSITRPPPVPVGTRPTSLMSNRESLNSVSTTSSRPLNSPRPLTSPPIKRANTVVTHRRTPSIPLVSPDLPPIIGRISRPTSHDGGSGFEKPVRPNLEHQMAKPPKVNFIHPTKSIPIDQTRPLSNNTTSDLPPIPKRSPPPDLSPPVTSPKQSPVMSIPEEQVLAPVIPKRPSYLEDGLDPKLRDLLQLELNKIRQEFEARLEDERIERLRLQTELDELKAYINQ